MNNTQQKYINLTRVPSFLFDMPFFLANFMQFVVLLMCAVSMSTNL